MLHCAQNQCVKFGVLAVWRQSRLQVDALDLGQLVMEQKLPHSAVKETDSPAI